MVRRFKLFLLFFLLVLVFVGVSGSLVWAQEGLLPGGIQSVGGGEFQEPEPVEEEVLEGRVGEVLEEQELDEEFGGGFYQRLEVLIIKGSLKGEKVVVEVGGEMGRVGESYYRVGDGVVLSRIRSFEGEDVFYITDFVRRKPLFRLFLIFFVLTILIGRWRGVSSLLGMGLSFLVIFKVILPRILAGGDPVGVAILGSLLIIPVTFYPSHGFNRKTTVAIFGTLISLVLTGLLAKYFVGWARLTGFASEEAGFLQVIRPGLVDMRGLVLAGIIIGVLGVLDDITIAQAAVVEQLRQADPNLASMDLFWRAMRVGQDHIASMVNTLVLVYAGAALPLLLLFVDTSVSFQEVVNHEAMAEEIIRTLVGSIGLVAAVPVTTFLAAVRAGSRTKVR